MKTLGIGIDGIIRDLIFQLNKIYNDQIGKGPKLPLINYNLIKYFPFQGGEKELNYFLYVENK